MTQLILGQSAFEKRASVDAGGSVTLNEDHVAGMVGGWRAPEVVETDLV